MANSKTNSPSKRKENTRLIVVDQLTFGRLQAAQKQVADTTGFSPSIGKIVEQIISDCEDDYLAQAGETALSKFATVI